MKVAGIAAGAVVLAFLALVGLAACSPKAPTTTAGACPAVVVPAGQMPTGTVAGYSGDQLANAAQILAAGAALDLSARDQTIGVMTAMGESSLRVLDYGDDAGPDSRGLFQQRANGAWGTYDDRMDPFTSASNFFKAMMKIENRDAMEPTEVAHRTQRNRDPNHYTRFWEPATAVVAALGGGGMCVTGAGAPGGDGRQLAAALVAKIDAGKITGLSGPVLDQIRWAATGENAAECSIDVRILQIITIASDTFDKVGISSINRYCTRTLAGAGTLSRHYLDGGGHAVDFYGFNGKATDGADANAVTLIRALDALLPPGSLIGQVQCRAAAGTSLSTQTAEQFNDTCNHLHIDVDPKTTTLLGSGAQA
ncbi:hypothetical protein [Cellulosimicrobium sp. NPDC057862]|uniref:hypothetical protein n=1 Tax=Actinomycetes TaxID=1760 RepID=UPI00366A6708